MNLVKLQARLYCEKTIKLYAGDWIRYYLWLKLGRVIDDPILVIDHHIWNQIKEDLK